MEITKVASWLLLLAARDLLLQQMWEVLGFLAAYPWSKGKRPNSSVKCSFGDNLIRAH